MRGTGRRLLCRRCREFGYQDRSVRSLAGVEGEVVGVADEGGVDVARIPRDRAARGDDLGSRPVERLAEDATGIHDATAQETLAAMIVVVAEQPGFGVEDQAGRGAHDIADVGLRALPGRPVIGGDDLELGGTDLRASDDEDFTLAEIDRGGFGRPLRFGQSGLHGGLGPGRTVVAAGHGAPRVRGFIVVVPGEPQGHESDLGDGEDVGDLHGAHGELRRRHEGEGHAIRGAVEVVLPLRADAAHPEEHRARGVQPLPDGDFGVVGCIGDDGFRRPRFAAVGGSAGEKVAATFIDGVSRAPAVNADQLVADGLHHGPGIVAAHVLHDVGRCGSGHGGHLDHG